MKRRVLPLLWLLVAIEVGAADVPAVFSSSFVPSVDTRTTPNLFFQFSAPELPHAALLAGQPVRMAPVTVNQSRFPEVKLRPTEVLSAKGEVDYAVQHYTSELYRATFGPLSQVATYYFNFLSILGGWHPNEAEALTLHREAERIRINREIKDLIEIQQVKDPKQIQLLRGNEFRFRENALQGAHWRRQ